MGQFIWSRFVNLIHHKDIHWEHTETLFNPGGLSTTTHSLSANRRRLVQVGQNSKKKDTGPQSTAADKPLLDPSVPKIVQLRPVTSNTYPFTATVSNKVQSASQFSQQSSSNCPPCTPPSSPCPPPPPPPPKTDNTLRNILLALLAGGAAIGGLYYAFGDTDNKKKVPKKCDKSTKTSRRKVIRNPDKKEDFPKKVPYLLIGGGTASFAAFRAIKSREPKARVLIISEEEFLPYMRPPLSKEIWHQENLPALDKLIFRQWNGQQRSIYYEPGEFYTNISQLLCDENGGVSVATGWVVSKVEPSNRSVELEDPKTNSKFTIEYDKCLIATGSRPKNLSIFEQANPAIKEKVVLFKNINDLENLWSRLETAKSIAIVGGGFLGSELACALANKYRDKNGPKVTQIFKESGNMGHVLPSYLAEWTTDKVRQEGVKVIPEVEVKELDMHKNNVVLTFTNESCIEADLIIVAVGSVPNVQLANTSELEVDSTQGGFLVNAELVARNDLYVAGDVACFYDPVLGRRRVEHHDHAVVSGRLAGENMTGASKGYKHQSMFWSDLGHYVGFEAIGVIDSCLSTVGVFAKGEPEKPTDRLAIDRGQESGQSVETNDLSEGAEKKEELDPLPKNPNCKDVTNKVSKSKDYNKGIIFYLKDGMVVGIVLWNVFNRMHTARQILAEKRKYEDLNEVAKLFKIHQEGDEE